MARYAGFKQKRTDLWCRLVGHRKATHSFTCVRCGRYTIPLTEQIARIMRRAAGGEDT